MKESTQYKAMIGGVILFVVSFWGTFIFVAYHFISKYW